MHGLGGDRYIGECGREIEILERAAAPLLPRNLPTDRELGGQRDVPTVVAHLHGMRGRSVGEAGRRSTYDRVVVVPVPRAAQPALFDRALAERTTLVRAMVVERAVAAVATGERERHATRG